MEYFIIILLILFTCSRKRQPKTYFKLDNPRNNIARSIIKPISLWKIDIFDYNVVFNRHKIVYFVKANIIDYFDFNLNISVKGIESKDLFLRDHCQQLPLAKDLTNKYFNSTHLIFPLLLKNLLIIQSVDIICTHEH
jgi:hypothetical protein